MWIGAISTLIAVLFVQRKPAVRAIFNAAQTAVTLGAAAAAFRLFGGTATGLDSSALPFGNEQIALQMAPPFLALFVVYLLVNRALVGVAVAWSTDRPYWKTLREDWFYAERLLEDAAAFLLAPLMVISFAVIRYVGVLLFYVPLQMLNESGRRHIELRKAQAELIKKERMAAAAQLARSLAHNLRGQLVGVSGPAQILIRDAERGKFDDVVSRSKVILEASANIERLMDELVRASREEFRFEKIDLNQRVRSSIELVRSGMPFEKVEWDLRLVEPSPMLVADSGRLNEVLVNLFNNAADAMHDRNGTPRVITVATTRDERAGRVGIVVSDTGPGIPGELLPRVFEPYFTTKGAKGNGFGLSTAYQIVSKHGGTIVATSPPGQGAVFTIVLPQNPTGGLA
jgi:signal transduction histidine kinase